MREIYLKAIIDWEDYDDVADELMLEDSGVFDELKIGVTVEPLSSDSVLGDGWRDASKELPEIDQEVLVYLFGAYCVMMRLRYTSPDGKTEIKWSDGNRSYIGVDAWRPLPDPPAFA